MGKPFALSLLFAPFLLLLPLFFCTVINQKSYQVIGQTIFITPSFCTVLHISITIQKSSCITPSFCTFSILIFKKVLVLPILFAPLNRKVIRSLGKPLALPLLFALFSIVVLLFKKVLVLPLLFAPFYY